MRNLASLSPDHCHSAASVPLVFWSVRDDCPRVCTVCATLHARPIPHPHIPLHVVNHNCITCYAAPFSAAAFRWQQSRSLQRHHRECRRPPGFHIPRSGRVRWPSRSWVVWASDENKQAKEKLYISLHYEIPPCGMCSSAPPCPYQAAPPYAIQRGWIQQHLLVGRITVPMYADVRSATIT